MMQIYTFFFFCSFFGDGGGSGLGGGLINHAQLLHCCKNLKIGAKNSDLKIMELCHYWRKKIQIIFFFFERP